jgi:mannosyltransferase OCH1-like enzyme
MADGGIPKKIHQIWLGTNAPPTEWMDTVEKFAADYGYEYKLWSESNVDTLDWDSIPGLGREYKKFKKETAGRADIVRLMILYKFGGIYIDADSVIMKPKKFAAFLEKNAAAVFFGWENLSRAHTKKLGDLGPELRGTRRLVANGLIGAEKEHPFLKRLLGGLISNSEREAKGQAWRRVGPLYVSRVYAKFKDEFPDVHVYPMKYFYPMHWKGITDPALHKRVKIPAESMLFQYGYSTNSFDKYFNARRKTRRLR